MAGAVAGNRNGERWQRRGQAVTVADTIGAGDAFLPASPRLFPRPADAACLAEAVEIGTRSTTIAGGRPPRPDHRSHS